MYRLYRMTDDGLHAVKNFDSIYICAHMATARSVAENVAVWIQESILITRVGKNGALKPTLVANPDGTFSRPPGTEPVSEREDCKAGTDEVCFCSPCRAERRLI